MSETKTKNRETEISLELYGDLIWFIAVFLTGIVTGIFIGAWFF